MHFHRWAARLLTILTLLALITGCNPWTPADPPPGPGNLPTPAIPGPEIQSGERPTPAPSPEPAQPLPGPVEVSSPGDGSLFSLEPAGCLSAEQQSQRSVAEMLDYADQLFDQPHLLKQHQLPEVWNGYQREYSYNGSALNISVTEVENRHLVQRALNALQVAGFVTWLRSPRQQLQILAIPLRDLSPDSPWMPYVQAYWQSSTSLPGTDNTVLPALKLPPCAWMVQAGYAPQADYRSWFPQVTGWPEYAALASAYLADNTQAALAVARRIGWLGEDGHAGPDTMCGPLAWSILHDAGALPPGWGAWSEGPKSFWLAKPTENGRPWSLFPSSFYQVYHFSDPLGRFDFQNFPLYPGDFLYTYSKKDGFDHMLVVTEVNSNGEVYTVTNKVEVFPVKNITIERVLLLNLNNRTDGIARNQWAVDGLNGRTGHDGFDVFRWAWMEKDIRGQAVEYTVQPGDTLDLIASLWKTPAARIAGYNEINSSTSLTVGMSLRIPPNETRGN